MPYSFQWLARSWNYLETQGTNNCIHKLRYGCRKFSISGNSPDIEFHPTSWETPRDLGTVSDPRDQVENERLLFMTSQFQPNLDICSCLILSGSWLTHNFFSLEYPPEPPVHCHSQSACWVMDFSNFQVINTIVYQINTIRQAPYWMAWRWGSSANSLLNNYVLFPPLTYVFLLGQRKHLFPLLCVPFPNVPYFLLTMSPLLSPCVPATALSAEILTVLSQNLCLHVTFPNRETSLSAVSLPFPY